MGPQLKSFHLTWLFLSLSCLVPLHSLEAQAPEFVSFREARPVLEAMRASLPLELRLAGGVTPGAWDQWVRRRDRQIRTRIAQGEELTLTNLLRLGITYTGQRRITFDLLDRYGRDPTVNSLAEGRAGDLIRALSAPHPSAGLLLMRDFLRESGFSLNSLAARERTKTYLLASLARQRDEVRSEQERARISHAELFKGRGLSTDSDLYIGYALELHLRDLLHRGLLKPGAIRRVAVIGPGLDFVNKKFGYDFYPPQVTQPFAVIDSLLRLGLADAASIRLWTFDINPSVNRHIESARTRAAAARAYTIQLLWSSSVSGSDSFRADFSGYWGKLGERIGNPVQPVAVPEPARSEVDVRAVRIRPEIVARITPVDMNAILQVQPLPGDQRFDLVIATNIFLYYDAWEQALARSNLAAMIRPEGFLISNTPLPSTAPSGLVDSVRTDIPLRPGLTDQVYGYRRADRPAVK
jgi:hypothetical protein